MRFRSVVAVAVLLVAAGCGSSPPATNDASGSGFPLTVENCGRSLTFDKPVQRVFTIASDSAVAVAAAGAANRIVTRSAEGGAPFGPYQPVLDGIPVISENSAPSVEAVIATRPDLVVAFDSTRQTLGPLLEEAGIKLMVPSWRCGGNSGTNSGTTFESLYNQINQLGEVFATSPDAAKTVADLQRRQAAVQDKFANLPKQTAATVYIDSAQLAVYGGPSFATTILGTLGLPNVFSDVNNQFSEIGREDLIGRNPAVIVLVYGGSGSTVRSDEEAVQLLRSIPGIETLDAVRSGRVLPINFTYVTGSPLSIDGLERLGNDLEQKQ